MTDATPLSELATEQVNPRTRDIDQLPTLEMLRRINAEDHLVADAVERELPAIAAAVDAVADRLAAGGRLVYSGAGTSGRLGILDATECPPTYGVDPGLVIGLIAGGRDAAFRSVEGAEDLVDLGATDLQQIHFTAQDALVGIAASGRTPYVFGAMAYAREVGGLVIGLSCSPDSPIAKAGSIAITPVVGAEAITGSTRMKAGTAQKMVLNMLSTGVMIKLGKVYGNLMIDVRASNAKLRDRAQRIVREATGVDVIRAAAMLEQTHEDVRLAVFALLSGLPPEDASVRLSQAGNRISQALASMQD